MTKTLTTEEFVAKAIAIHGDRYDYSKTKYIDRLTPVIIICPIHGEFLQTPSSHCIPRHCQKCGLESQSIKRRSNTEEFIAKARAIHGDKYDYSKVIYTKAIKPVIITCPIHGDFEQIAISHFTNGCPLCSNNKRLTTEEFIAKARAIHGDRYDYSKVIYVNRETPVIISCPIHGDFEYKPVHFLRGFLCPVCSKIKSRLTTEEFIAKARAIHGDKYDYSLVKYITSRTLITIKCPIHGNYTQKPSLHLEGKSCPRCSESKGELKITNILDKLNISYIREYVIINNPYRYDFYLPDYDIYVEYHGEQHYRYIEYFHKNIRNFENQKIRDNAKKRLVSFCGGTLITISYISLRNDTIEEFLINRINKITKSKRIF